MAWQPRQLPGTSEWHGATSSMEAGRLTSPTEVTVNSIATADASGSWWEYGRRRGWEVGIALEMGDRGCGWVWLTRAEEKEAMSR